MVDKTFNIYDTERKCVCNIHNISDFGFRKTLVLTKTNTKLTKTIITP